MLELFLHLLFLFCLCRYTDCQDPQVILDGKPATIQCGLINPPTVLWFRVGNTGMDVIGFIDSKGEPHYHADANSAIINKEKIEIKEFNKERDSGIYGCSMTAGQILSFGKTTILAGPTDPTTMTTPLVTTAPPPSTATTPCPCKTLKKPDTPGSCEVAILAPLVVGCILLFLILILTIHHCNHIRTRGCPHHYKQRPRNPTQANIGKPGRYT